MQLTTPRGEASDAFYQELLGIAIRAILVRTNEVTSYSDCKSAIRRFWHATNHLGAAIGHHTYGQLRLSIQGIWARQSHTLTWVKAHPERTKSRDTCDIHDHGIYMADLIAGCPEGRPPKNKKTSSFTNVIPMSSFVRLLHMGHEPGAKITCR